MSTVLSTPTVAHSSTVAAAEAANRASLTPLDRLALSREQLRRALQIDAVAPRDASPGDAERGPVAALIGRLKAIPGTGVLADALLAWWGRQPLRFAGAIAFAAATAVVRPVARRNPLSLVAIALLLGGVVAWARPWRWILRSTLFVGLSSELLRMAVPRVPFQSWFKVLTLLERAERAAAQVPDGVSSSKGRRIQD
jgi:hypothetical protein